MKQYHQKDSDWAKSNSSEIWTKAGGKRIYRRLLSDIARLYAQGLTTPSICKELGISKQDAKYWRDKALLKHAIELDVPGRPRIYKHGRRYNAICRVGDSRNSPIVSRTHTGPGTMFIYRGIKSGDTPHFTESGSLGVTIQTLTLRIPAEIVGFEHPAPTATIDLRTYYGPLREELRIYPPFIEETALDIA